MANVSYYLYIADLFLTIVADLNVRSWKWIVESFKCEKLKMIYQKVGRQFV